ncbi:cell division topological specificity factor MinE [Christensenella timonensis]|uniref:cell division topological specificity factor MinE n=1 Tax=Christensenella timonensis TaxID=1816678 RepID=UPI000832E0B1|nr:cell division topological specificity factor MinE [Christensenella timonensis]
MGWFFNRKKSSQVAKDRLKLVLIYDRAGTTSNDDMIDMIKRDIMQVISKYVEIDESEFAIDFKNVQNEEEEGISSQLAMNIPIKKIKQMVKNSGR